MNFNHDKEKKQSFNKQVCIGKKGPDGSFIPNAHYRELHQLAPTGEKITVVSKVIGATETLTNIAKAEGLERCLTLSLGKQMGSQALALAEYILVRGMPYRISLNGLRTRNCHREQKCFQARISAGFLATSPTT